MSEEKGLLIKSIHKLIKHIRLGPKNQEEIFASFGPKDIQKIVKNLEDSNFQLRKASFALIVHLISNSHWKLRKNFCNYLKIPLITGKIVLNPNILSSLDTLYLKDLIYMLKYDKESQNYHQKRNSQLQLLWFVNLKDDPHKIHELTLDDLVNLDPKYCIFGLNVHSDILQINQPEYPSCRQKITSSQHKNKPSMEQQSEFSQSQPIINHLKPAIANAKPDVSQLHFEQRKNVQKPKNKISFSHRQHFLQQKNTRQNNSLDKYNSPKSQIKQPSEHSIKKAIHSTYKKSLNEKCRQSNSTYQSKNQSSNYYRQSGSHYEKNYIKYNEANNLYVTSPNNQSNQNSISTSIPISNSYMTYYSPYNVHLKNHQYNKGRQAEKNYQTENFGVNHQIQYQNQQNHKREGISSPYYRASVLSPNGFNNQSIVSSNAQTVNPMMQSNYTVQSGYSQNSAINGHFPQSRSNMKQAKVYLTNNRPRQMYGHTYTREYNGKY